MMLQREAAQSYTTRQLVSGNQVKEEQTERQRAPHVRHHGLRRTGCGDYVRNSSLSQLTAADTILVCSRVHLFGRSST